MLALCLLLVGVHAPLSARSQGRGAASATAPDGVYKSFGLSPDARTFLYLRAAGAFPTFELYLRDTETGATTRVTNEAVHHAAWSPDGKTLAYQWLDLDGRFHVCLYDIATRESTELAAGRLKPDFLEWSPDSAELLYLTVEPHGQDAFETGEWDSTLHRHPLRGGPVMSIPGVQWARFSEGQLVVAGNPAPAGYRSIPNPNAERIERFAIHDGQIYANTHRDGTAGASRWNAAAGAYEPASTSRLASGGPLTAPAGANWRLPYYGLAAMVQGGAGFSGGACDGAVCMVIAHNARLNYALDFQQVSEANEGNQHILAVEAGTVAALANGLACSTMMACTVSYDGYSQTCKDPNTGAGNYVAIAHMDGSYSFYAHLKSGSVAVQVGQTVAQGAYLADQGHSGGAAAYNNYRTCGDHLHYQRQTAPAVWSQAIPTDFEDTPCLLACTNIYPSKNVELAPAPSVVAIQPVSALAGSTVNVTFTGSNYLYGTTLTVSGSGVTAGTVSVVSATQATATLVVAPDAALGPRDLVLTTARGSSQPLPFQVSVPVAVTLATQPAGLTLSVDGQSCISPCALQWHSGTNHTIAAPVVVIGVPGVTGTRLAWKTWSDGGTAAHSVTTPLTAVTYTAVFATQYLLTTVAAPSAMGSIAPATGWFDSGTIVPVSATPAAGFAFTGFSGVLTGIVTPQPVTMAGPLSVTAGFRSLYSLSPAALNFAGPVGGAALTAPQVITVNGSGGINTWTATSDKPWLQVTPIAGQRNGRFTISILRSALPPLGIYTGKVTITAGAAYAGSLVLPCTLSMKPFTGAPFGTLETPADGATGLAGSVAVTGWALDDIGVNKVTIWRDRVGAEGVHPNGLVYIGDATFVSGARPDVEASQPGLPAAYRAGWGYLLLTNALPGPPGKGGNGVFKFHAFAVDEEGNQTKLGTKSFTVDNQSSVRPFGTIDSPAPGETVSGASFSNSGWALTPQPSVIPADGSTIWVNIDGVNFAHPQYGGARSDVASIFPAFANSLASAGVYALDTTKYANGTHTIAWIVLDNLNHADGIGSRFFEIQNAPPAATGSVDAAPPQGALARAARPRRVAASDAANPAFRTGYSPGAALAPIRMAGDGLYEAVALPEMGLLEIQLPAGAGWQAALRFGGERRELPIGSTFDAESGTFYWQAGPGFLGRFELEFLSAGVPPLVIPVELTARR
ncbi:MAG: peptidoglycan DD-metalloendopeptidase family protein [Bryobacterales bacterium]|nr:peptidoglycan DD-metalloendopeptidase family protein [Bryobacterales bacterium]